MERIRIRITCRITMKWQKVAEILKEIISDKRQFFVVYFRPTENLKALKRIKQSKYFDKVDRFHNKLLHCY